MEEVATRQQAWLGPQDADPELSVVVGLVDGRVASLRRALGALAGQIDAPSFEVIVPYDEPCRDVTGLADAFPQVRFQLVEDLDTLAARRGSSREHHDTLKTVGLRSARAEFIALTEDQAEVSPGWCREMVNAMRAHPHVSAFGGAMENGGRGVMAHAMYLCDFGRFQNPLPEGPAHAVSDANVVYRREALQAVEASWRDDYHERLVHDAMQQRGQEIWQTPEAVTRQVRDLGFGQALCERVVWGRSFAATRGRVMARSHRWLLACLAPVLPLLLTWRVLWGALRRGRLGGPALLAMPAVFLLNCAWSVGEFVGGVTGTTGA